MHRGGVWRLVLVWVLGVAAIVAVATGAGLGAWSLRPPGDLELEAIGYALLALAAGLVVGAVGWVVLVVAIVRRYVSRERRGTVIATCFGVAGGLVVLTVGAASAANGHMTSTGAWSTPAWGPPLTASLEVLLALAVLVLPAVVVASRRSDDAEAAAAQIRGEPLS